MKTGDLFASAGRAIFFFTFVAIACLSTMTLTYFLVRGTVRQEDSRETDGSVELVECRRLRRFSDELVRMARELKARQPGASKEAVGKWIAWEFSPTLNQLRREITNDPLLRGDVPAELLSAADRLAAWGRQPQSAALRLSALQQVEHAAKAVEDRIRTLGATHLIRPAPVLTDGPH